MCHGWRHGATLRPTRCGAHPRVTALDPAMPSLRSRRDGQRRELHALPRSVSGCALQAMIVSGWMIGLAVDRSGHLDRAGHDCEQSGHNVSSDRVQLRACRQKLLPLLWKCRSCGSCWNCEQFHSSSRHGDEASIKIEHRTRQSGDRCVPPPERKWFLRIC